FDQCYSAIASRDARFDGRFIVAVRTTGIYCRPSCPTPVTPKRENVAFFVCAAAAQLAGFRACNRCRPDAIPGSPEWDVRAELRGAKRRGEPAEPGSLTVRLALRQPYDAEQVLGWLGARAVTGIEEQDGQSYRRTLALPHGTGTVILEPRGAVDHVLATFRLA